MEKSPCKLNLLHCRQKPRPLCERGMKRELEWQGKCGHRLIVHSITRRGEIWEKAEGGGGGWSEETVGGGGAAPLYQLISEPGEVVWQYIYFSTLIKKGTFTYSDSNPRDSRNQEMWRWCSQIASDYMKSCINPLRLVSAPPPPPLPPAPPPLSQASVLIASLVNLTRGTQGCPKIISFDKSNWHPNFWRVFFNLLFLCCFATRTFSQHPLLKKCTPFFPSIINPRNLFPLPSLLQLFHLSLINANYSYRRILKPPC